MIRPDGRICKHARGHTLRTWSLALLLCFLVAEGNVLAQVPGPREVLPPPIGPLVAGLLCGNGLVDPGEECDGGAGDCSSGCVPPGSERSCQCDQPPAFPGLVLVAGTAVDELTLAWLPAQDDTTPPKNIRYELHASTVQGFEPDSSTLRGQVTGQAQDVVTGLQADREYFVLVVAVDENGNRSLEREEGRARTPAFSPVREAGVDLKEASELGLGEPEVITPDELRFAKTQASSAPAPGSLLMGPVQDNGYLRRVLSVSETSSHYVVSTRDASLREAFHTFPLHSEVTLVDVEQQAANAATRTGFLRPAVRAGSLADSGTFAALRWDDGLLAARQERHSDTSTESLGQSWIVDAGGATFEVTLDFEPAVRGDFDWTLAGGVTRASVVARGTLTATVTARYSHSGSETRSFDRQLFRRSFTTRFLVGGVPVYQEVILTLSASGSVQASSEIDASKTAEATSFVELGLEYDPAAGSWVPVQGTGFDRSVAADLSIAGSVEGEVRLIPEISLRYYRIVSARLSAEPFGTASLAARVAPVHEPCEAPELTRFDASVGMDCNVSADVTVLNNTLAKAGPLEICGIAPLRLFGLPDITIMQDSGSGTEHDPFVLQAVVTDGPGNAFETDSAEWTRPDDNPGDLRPDPVDPFRVEYVCPDDLDDSYTVVFSGHGVLGDPALQCKAVDVDCACPPDGCVHIFFSGNTVKQFVFGISRSECTSEASTTIDESCAFPAGLGGPW